MIGIIVAMEKELSALPLCNIREEQVGGHTFLCGTLCDKDVVCAISGIGKVFAAMCAQTMILHYAPSAIINCGVAGALSPSLHLCDIVIGTSAVQHDMDTSPCGDPPGLISGINLIELPCDNALSDALFCAASAAGLSAHRGILASGDRFCADKTEKEAIAARFSAIACEMEGGAVAQVCFVNHVPCALFRAISDNADADASMTYETFTKKAAQNAAKVLVNFLSSI